MEYNMYEFYRLRRHVMGVYMFVSFLLSFTFIVAPNYATSRTFTSLNPSTLSFYQACLESGIDIEGVAYPAMGRVIQPSFFTYDDVKYSLMLRNGVYSVSNVSTNEIVCQTPREESS